MATVPETLTNNRYPPRFSVRNARKPPKYVRVRPRFQRGSLKSREPRFTGKEYDSDADLYYFCARWYDEKLGRFTQSDPIRDGNNWYAYCNNSPLCYTDPLGLAGQKGFVSEDYDDTEQDSEVYTVESGDELHDIADKEYGDPEYYHELGKYNDLANNDKIKEGQYLFLPPKSALDDMAATGSRNPNAGQDYTGGIADAAPSIPTPQKPEKEGRDPSNPKAEGTFIYPTNEDIDRSISLNFGNPYGSFSLNDYFRAMDPLYDFKNAGADIMFGDFIRTLNNAGAGKLGWGDAFTVASVIPLGKVALLGKGLIRVGEEVAVGFVSTPKIVGLVKAFEEQGGKIIVDNTVRVRGSERMLGGFFFRNDVPTIVLFKGADEGIFVHEFVHYRQAARLGINTTEEYLKWSELNRSFLETQVTAVLRALGM